jgi:hypothetical protein
VLDTVQGQAIYQAALDAASTPEADAAAEAIADAARAEAEAAAEAARVSIIESLRSAGSVLEAAPGAVAAAGGAGPADAAPAATPGGVAEGVSATGPAAADAAGAGSGAAPPAAAAPAAGAAVPAGELARPVVPEIVELPEHIDMKNNPRPILERLPSRLLRQLPTLLGEAGISDAAATRTAEAIKLLVETAPAHKGLMLHELEAELHRWGASHVNNP